MKRLSVRLGAIMFVVGGLITVLWPVPAWRMYDANWNPLAMTEAEAYCSGKIISSTGNLVNEKNPEAFAACIADSGMMNEKPQIGVVIPRFCEGIATSVPFPVEDCVSQVNAYDIWPLLDGGWTWEWNDSNPRPNIVQTDISKAPRGERGDSTERDTEGRLGG